MKNRHTALRLPAIWRFAHRRDDLVQHQVRLVKQSDPAETPRDASAERCRRRLALPQLRNAAPRSPPRRADSVAFGRLAPRGPGLHLFNHPGTQVDGIGIRHCSLQKTNQCRQTRSSTKRWDSFRFEPSEICHRTSPPPFDPVLHCLLNSAISDVRIGNPADVGHISLCKILLVRASNSFPGELLPYSIKITDQPVDVFCLGTSLAAFDPASRSRQEPI